MLVISIKELEDLTDAKATAVWIENRFVCVHINNMIWKLPIQQGSKQVNFSHLNYFSYENKSTGKTGS